MDTLEAGQKDLVKSCVALEEESWAAMTTVASSYPPNMQYDCASQRNTVTFIFWSSALVVASVILVLRMCRVARANPIVIFMLCVAVGIIKIVVAFILMGIVFSNIGTCHTRTSTVLLPFISLFVAVGFFLRACHSYRVRMMALSSNIQQVGLTSPNAVNPARP